MITVIRSAEGGRTFTIGDDTALAARKATIATEAADDATVAKALAQAAQALAEVAAEVASGAVTMKNTKAAATADLATIAEGEYVTVLADEGNGGARVVYQKSGGALVQRANLSNLVGQQALVGANGGGTMGTGKAPLMLTSGTAATDRPLDLVIAAGATGLRVRKNSETGHFAEFYPNFGAYAQWPACMITDGAGFNTVGFNITSGLVWRDPASSRIYFLPASTTYANNGFEIFEADGETPRPGVFGRSSMQSFRADVTNATVEIAGNHEEPGCFILSYCDAVSGEEIGGVDASGNLWWGPGGAGDAGRANLDVKIGRTSAKTVGVDGALKLVPRTLAAAPDPAVAGPGTMAFLLDHADGPGLYFSDGTDYVSIGAAAGLAPFDWTPALRNANVTQTATTPPTFEKTTDDGGDWYQNIFYETENHAGDLRVEFRVLTGGTMIVGLAPSPSDDNDYSAWKFGLLVATGGETFGLENGTVGSQVGTFSTFPTPNGSRFYIERVGDTWNAGTVDGGVLVTADATGSGSVSLAADLNAFGGEVAITYYGPPL